VSQVLDVTDFEYDYASLVKMKVNGQDEILQYDKVEDDGIRYSYILKGNSVKMSVFSESQFKYKHFMPEPTKIDYAKSIISPMPGAIVQVFVQPGDHVVEGQQLCVIEAMKMQNILKAEIEGKIE